MAASHALRASDHPAHAKTAPFAEKWWAIAIRGVLGITFGVIAFVMPGVTMLSLVYVFGAYAVLDGVAAIVSAFRAARGHGHWALLVLEGAAGIVVGVLAWVWPGISLVVFVLMVGAWAVVSGVLMYAGAFALHVSHGRWWLVLGGVASMVYGGILVVSPIFGALVLTWWIGAYAIVFGGLLLGLAWRLRARHRAAEAEAAAHHGHGGAHRAARPK